MASNRNHGITLILDALAPDISGVKELEAAGKIDMTEEIKEFVIHAEDNGSGIRILTVTITNQDNLLTETYASTDGDLLAFTLEADLQRAREPHDGDFKAGDGGTITVTTGGYADKVIIRFPAELVVLNPELNQEYLYE